MSLFTYGRSMRLTRYSLNVAIVVTVFLIASCGPSSTKNSTTDRNLAASPLGSHDTIKLGSFDIIKTDFAFRLDSVRPLSDGWLHYQVTVLNVSKRRVSGIRGVINNPEIGLIQTAVSGADLLELPSMATTVMLQTKNSAPNKALIVSGNPFVGSMADLDDKFSEKSLLDKIFDKKSEVLKIFWRGDLQNAAIISGEVREGGFFFPYVKADAFIVYYTVGGEEYSVQFGESQGDPTSVKPGNQVLSVQEELKRRGYNPGVIDGEMGSRTERAIRRFQEDAGLEVTGQIDQRLVTALFSGSSSR